MVRTLALPTDLPRLQGKTQENTRRFEKLPWKERKTQKSENPEISSVWEEIQDLNGDMKRWLKYYLFATAIFVYSHEMLVKSGLSENDRENLPLFCPWNSNGIIGLPDKKCNIYNWHDTIRIYIRNIMEK